MDTLMKCAALAVAGALTALAVRRQSGEFGALVGVASVVMLGVLALELLKPVLTFAEGLQDRAKLSQGVMTPVVKTLAIGFVTELGGSVCEDAGEKAVGSALRLCGELAALYVLLPLLQSVLDLLDNIL